MFKKILSLCLIVASQQLQAQELEILPKYPQAGQMVKLIYRPSVADEQLIDSQKKLDLVFTSSTFYDLPWNYQMIREGKQWSISFKIPVYGTFASFYFQSGKFKDGGAGKGDYTLAVYKGKKRIRDSYFHESYSIRAQQPKLADLAERQVALLQNELMLYPNNFEAKVRMKSIQMGLAKDAKVIAALRSEARAIINQQFESAPKEQVNLDRVAMGFGMIGEGFRTDSVKKLVLQRFPTTDAARTYLVAQIVKKEDSLTMAKRLDSLLANGKGIQSDLSIHKILFTYKLSKGLNKEAIEHARMSLAKDNPNTPKQLREIAQALINYKTEPELAYNYAQQAFSKIDQWPVGNIRLLPRFGYIYPFVEDSVRTSTVIEAKAGLLAIMALAKLYMDDKPTAVALANETLKTFENEDNLKSSAMVYLASDQAEKAYTNLWKLIEKNPFDENATINARSAFLKFNSSSIDFDKKLKELQDSKNNSLSNKLKTQLLNTPITGLDKITDLAAKQVNMDNMRGKIVIMDFWATWCVPCMKEMPYFQKVYDKFRNNPKVIFMAINTGAGNTIDDAKNWNKKNPQYTFPIYFNNDKEIGKKIGFNMIPAITMLDQNGMMQFRNVGFEGAEMENKLIQQIEMLLSL